MKPKRGTFDLASWAGSRPYFTAVELSQHLGCTPDAAMQRIIKGRHAALIAVVQPKTCPATYRRT